MERYYVYLVAHIRRSDQTLVKRILWTNGGVGYTEDELKNRVIPKLKADDRVQSYRIEKI